MASTGHHQNRGCGIVLSLLTVLAQRAEVAGVLVIKLSLVSSGNRDFKRTLEAEYMVSA